MSRKLYILQTSPVGRVIELDTESWESRVVVDNLDAHPDGIAVQRSSKRVFWTNMGRAKEEGVLEFFQADGSIQSASLDGSGGVQTVVSGGLFVTGKQLVLDNDTGYLYWCDREGMRVFRAGIDGSNVAVLAQTGIFPHDSQDRTRHCVGIALDKRHERVFWTQKGPPKGGKGRIFSAPLPAPGHVSAAILEDSASSPRLELDNLPEPIDLEFSSDYSQLYWTDRGDAAKDGNSLNVGDVRDGRVTNHRVIARGFDETISLAVDQTKQVVYVSDLSGKIYQHSLETGQTKVVASGFGPLTGIVLADV